MTDELINRMYRIVEVRLSSLSPPQPGRKRTMSVEQYDGYTHKFHGDQAGIRHKVSQLIHEDDETWDMLNISMWAEEEVPHCRICGREPVSPKGICLADAIGSPSHSIEVVTRKREIVMWLTFDQAFKLGLSILQDVSLGKYGSGV